MTISPAAGTPLSEAAAALVTRQGVDDPSTRRYVITSKGTARIPQGNSAASTAAATSPCVRLRHVRESRTAPAMAPAAQMLINPRRASRRAIS